MMHSAVIGIGSNLNADSNIEKSMDLLSMYARIVKISEIITTQPIGIIDQPDFINGALAVETNLEQADLRKRLKEIEDRLGRDRSRPKFGPREIDLDIVVYDNIVVDSDYYSRDFLKVLVDSVRI